MRDLRRLCIICLHLKHYIAQTLASPLTNDDMSYYTGPVLHLQAHRFGSGLPNDLL